MRKISKYEFKAILENEYPGELEIIYKDNEILYAGYKNFLKREKDIILKISGGKYYVSSWDYTGYIKRGHTIADFIAISREYLQQEGISEDMVFPWQTIVDTEQDIINLRKKIKEKEL